MDEHTKELNKIALESIKLYATLSAAIIAGAIAARLGYNRISFIFTVVLAFLGFGFAVANLNVLIAKINARKEAVYSTASRVFNSISITCISGSLFASCFYFFGSPSSETSSTLNPMLLWLKTDINLTSAIATIFSAITAIFAVALSVISIWIQRRHNVLSVRPLPEVTVADYENSLFVKIQNNGFGPLIIAEMRVKNESKTKESLIDWIPRLPRDRYWTDFSTKLKDRTLEPNGEITLLELTQAPDEDDFHEIRDFARKKLCKLMVEVDYTDLYGSRLKTYKKSMSWFGRHV